MKKEYVLIMKRILFGTAFAIILVALGLISGCGRTQTADMSEDEQITMDWYVNYSWFVTGWGDNLVSEEITDRTKVDVNFITPIGDERNKLNTLIDSNTLPDIVTIGWWEPQIQKMIDNDLVYPLNELADLYDPSFYDVTRKEIRDWYTLSDGNIYCYPNSSYTPEDVASNDNIAPNQTFLVRKDIYEAIGSPDMSTPENFYDAVVKAAEMFPDVDGKPLIPVGGHEFNSDGCASFDQYLQNFLAVPYEKDGQKYDRYTDPEYITWLKMFRKLAESGYLADDIFVDQRTQTSEKIEEGRYFCMLYQRTDMADQQKILYDKNPEKIYIAIDGPRNSRGDDPVLPVNGIAGWTLTFISKNCKDPERAIKFIDYLMSEEGQKITYLGIEGKTYDMKGDVPVIKPEVKELLSADREAYNTLYGADNTYWMLQNNVLQLKWQTEIDEPLRQMNEWACPYAAYVGQYEVYINEDSELGRIYASTRSLWGKTLPMLLLAGSDDEFDRILKDYLEQRKALGYDELAAEETRQIKRNKEKLGL